MAIEKSHRSERRGIFRRVIATPLFARRPATPTPPFAALAGRATLGCGLRRPLVGSCAMRAPVGRRNGHANELLDIADERDFVAIAQRDRNTVGAGARRSADAMHIGFRQVRHIEIHHMADAIDIDAARGNIRGDERLDLAFAESRQHTLALVLRFVAVDRFGGDAGPVQSARNLVGAVFGTRENQGAVDRLPAATRR